MPSLSADQAVEYVCELQLMCLADFCAKIASKNLCRARLIASDGNSADDIEQDRSMSLECHKFLYITIR